MNKSRQTICETHLRAKNPHVKVDSKVIEVSGGYLGCTGYCQRRVVCSKCGYDKTFIYPAN